MSLLIILLLALIVVVIFLVVRWLLGLLNVHVDQNLLVVGAVILFILALLGRVNLGV